MRYTLGQARKKLAGFTHAWGSHDVRESVNDAIQALAGMSGWECLRRVLRISSAGPVFALPQGCAGLVRVCVNGRPMTIRGQDFEFLHSGPGDLSRPPSGYRPIVPGNVIDRGEHPVYHMPGTPFRVTARTDKPDQPGVVVVGVGPDGTRKRVFVKSYQAPTVDFQTGQVVGVETDVRDSYADDVLIRIDEVVIAHDATSYINLYAMGVDQTTCEELGRYNPEVKVPRFHWYEIVGLDRPGYELLVEVRLDPLPLIEDCDVLPFDTLDPIEWMIMASWKFRASEIDAAQKYQNQAANWLKAREVAADTFQTTVVVNNIYQGSLGETSMDAFNI